jgi:hypothetical protein
MITIIPIPSSAWHLHKYLIFERANNKVEGIKHVIYVYRERKVER